MVCLKGYIGLKWCNGEAPESGIYITTLPGISLKSLDALANNEQSTFLGVWNDVQDRAIIKLNTAVQNHFSKRYSLSKVVEAASIGKVIDTTTTTAGAAQYRGLSMGLGINKSPLQSIFIKTVSIFSPVAKSGVDVKFFEILNNTLGNVRLTKTVELAEGWNTVNVNTSFTFQKLFIGYDATGIDSVTLTLDQYNGDFCCASCEYIRGAHSALSYTGLTEGLNTFGLSMEYSIQCSYEALTCSVRNVFATALWYMMGAECMFERLYSDRLNKYTTVDRENAEKLFEYYTAKADEELNNAISGIRLRCDRCIGADAPLTIVNNLP